MVKYGEVRGKLVPVIIFGTYPASNVDKRKKSPGLVEIYSMLTVSSFVQEYMELLPHSSILPALEPADFPLNFTV